MRTFLLVAMLVALPMQVQAAFWPGDQLVGDMREYENPDAEGSSWYSAGAYMSYVMGAYDAYESAELICPPGNATAGQVNAVVAAYLKANPGDWHLAATTLVHAALKEAFPCG